MRSLAFLWLAIVLMAFGYLSLRAYHGIKFDTDLMALLPQEERDPALKLANEAVTQNLSRQIIILIGNDNADEAIKASVATKESLKNIGLVDIVEAGNKEDIERMGSFYFPFRGGLVSQEDRRSLRQGEGGTLVTRSLAQIYNFSGVSNPALLRKDPFLLLPSFFTSLPLPSSKFSNENGVLSFKEKNKTWVMVTGKLTGQAFSIDTQNEVVSAFEKARVSLKALYPQIEILHVGAVFFASAQSQKAMSETSTIGFISTLGTMLILLLVFRSALPIALSLMALGVGIFTALSACLFIFGTLHVGALLFGVSLIGIAVDYSLEYCSEIFYPPSATPAQRLKKSVMGISLGTATTVIGYLTLFFAPFPGLKQVALFSTIGLTASWVTVILWLPRLDGMKTPGHRAQIIGIFSRVSAFFLDKNFAVRRQIILVIVIVAGVAGYFNFKIDDDVRHLQALPKSLMSEQQQIQELTGTANSSSFFLIEGNDFENVLQSEENLAEKLYPLVESRNLSGFRGISNFIPSVKRQKENRELAAENLYKPYLAAQKSQVQLKGGMETPDMKAAYLTEKSLQNLKPEPAFLSYLSLGNVNGKIMHIVMLDKIMDMDALIMATKDIKNVRLVNPVSDITSLLGKYRERALYLLALSTLLMVPLLLWRYGIKHGLYMMIPPFITVIMTPGICALFGSSFTFFNAMALVLVLSLALDYVIFCSESKGDHRPVTLLAISMTGFTTFLSFGLLVFSSVSAVHSFGITMLVGTILAVLLSPMVFRNEKVASV